jgi:hypothetical protein
MKYLDVKLKYFRIAAISALAGVVCIFVSARNTADAAPISPAASTVQALAKSAPDAVVEKAYWYYRRWHRWHRWHYWRPYRHYYWHRWHRWHRWHYWHPWRRYYYW